MKAFFCDLDHTLIYSHRQEIRDARIPVEWLNGKEQSYMTAYSHAFLREARWLTLIPVTTRSEEQYRRLAFPEEFRIRHALLCNGGKLLSDGREDRSWSEETMERAREVLGMLDEAGRRLARLSGGEVRQPEPYYRCAAAEDPEGICGALRREFAGSGIRAERDRRKVYLFPECVNKGEAVRRFAEKYGVTESAGAGDSEMDLPMLNAVRYPMAPETLRGIVSGTNTRWLAGEILSDRICRALEELHGQNIL